MVSSARGPDSVGLDLAGGLPMFYVEEKTISRSKSLGHQEG